MDTTQFLDHRKEHARKITWKNIPQFFVSTTRYVNMAPQTSQFSPFQKRAKGGLGNRNGIAIRVENTFLYWLPFSA